MITAKQKLKPSDFIKKVKEKCKEYDRKIRELEKQEEAVEKQAVQSPEYQRLKAEQDRLDKKIDEIEDKLSERRDLIKAGFMKDKGSLHCSIESTNIAPEVIAALQKRGVAPYSYANYVLDAIDDVSKNDAVLMRLEEKKGLLEKEAYDDRNFEDEMTDLVEDALEPTKKQMDRLESQQSAAVKGWAVKAVKLGLQPVQFNCDSDKCLFGNEEIRQKMLEIIPRKERRTPRYTVDLKIVRELLEETKEIREDRMTVAAL